MKILMIAPQPFFEPRGTPISVYQRINGLSKLGHQVDLVTYPIGNNVTIPGLTIYRTHSIPFIKSIKVGPSWQKIPLDILLFFTAFGRLQKERYDILHTHEEAGSMGVFLARIFKISHLYDMHSSLPRQLENFNFGNYRLITWFFKKLEAKVFSTCQAMIVIGPDLEEYVRSINNQVPVMMIENLPLEIGDPSGTNLDSTSLRKQLGIDAKMVIVYTGTLERYQGVELLLKSVAIIKDEFQEAVYLIVGGKPSQIDQLSQLAKELHIEDIVKFVGTLPLAEANRFIALADILVSPRIEGTSVPLKVYTYLSAGKPIVATNLIAHTLVLNDDTAILVEPTAEAIAAGMLQLLRDPALRQKLGENSRKLAEEKYNQANYLKKLAEIYQVLAIKDSALNETVSALEKK